MVSIPNEILALPTLRLKKHPFKKQISRKAAKEE
jgi:hypothetical protein